MEFYWKELLKKLINKKGEYICIVLAPLVKVGLPLMKNVLTSLAKSVLTLLKLTAAASATGEVTQLNIEDQG